MIYKDSFKADFLINLLFEPDPVPVVRLMIISADLDEEIIFGQEKIGPEFAAAEEH